MTPFLFFASIFLFVLINTYFFSSPKFLSWLSALLLKCVHVVKQTKKKKKKEENEIPVLVIEKTEIETVFSTFDKDGDGFITIQELEESLRKLGLFSTEKELVSMIERVDVNGDGLIDLGEFQKLYESIVKGNGNGDDDDDEDQKEMDLKEAFDVFDGNRDGLITVDELGLVLSSLGLGRRVEDYKEMIKKVDLDGDGMVNFDEFKRMMMSNNVGKLL